MKDLNDLVISDVKKAKDIVIKFLGFKDRRPPLPILKKIDYALSNFEEYIKTDYSYTINMEEKYIDLVYTIGNDLEAFMEENLNDSNAFLALCYDKIGVISLDMLRKRILEEIYNTHKLNPKKILTPGSKLHPISFQKEIFSNVKINSVSINEFNQLYPIKSVAIRILFDEGGEFKNYSPCKFCEVKCEFRICGGNDE